MIDHDPRAIAADAARSARDVGSGVPAYLLSVLLGPLPLPWRSALDRRCGLRPGQGALASGLLQLALGLGLAAVGFMAYMASVFAAIDAQAAKAPNREAAAERRVMGRALLYGNPLLTLQYALLTPVGFLTTLTWLGGGVRLVALGATREAAPDPTLAAIEWARQAIATGHATRRREREKGEVTPDLHVLGSGAWDLCIVTRDEYPWREAAGIVVAGAHYRLVSKREIRDELGRLRMAYELKRLGPAEVLRGVNVYRPSLPPVLRGAEDVRGAQPAP